jgi:signal transduction histidine kinase
VEGRRAWLGPTILVAGIVVAVAVGQSGGDAGVAALLYGGPWGFGRMLRARERRLVELAGETVRAELAVEAERARIARELHDVVSHSISVVAIQTQAVRRRLGPDHAREAADLEGVETTARQAMAEMRRLLGVLRAGDGDSLPLAPQPGLDQLPRLLDRARETGLDVRLDVDGTPVPLPPGIDLAAYRVVQEALTNAMRHAAADAVDVRLSWGERDLELRVEDDGVGAASANGHGHGLFGMRERVALYGGTVETGVRPGGGFAVRARLPVREGA